MPAPDSDAALGRTAGPDTPTVEIISIAARFCGPPTSGNGGYVAGMLANHAERPVRVRLRKPPPLTAPMVVRRQVEGRLELRRDGELIAEAEPFDFTLEVPRPPAYIEALDASRAYPGFRQHPFPSCFVCGPQRARCDGLRIFPGRLPGREVVAAPWIADDSLCAADGKVCSEFMWAALDCPGYFAAAADGRVMLLGQIAVHVDRRVHAAESCVVLGWGISSEGRKHIVGTALFDDDGEPCARALATWIEPEPRSA
jgi:hypothetical protein